MMKSHKGSLYKHLNLFLIELLIENQELSFA